MPSALRRAIDGPPLSALGLVWPWIAPWRVRSAAGRPEPVPDGPSFTLLSSNALGRNKRAADYAAAVAAFDADVVLVVEASDLVLDALGAAEVEHHHGPGLIERRPRYGGVGIWSSHPIERLETGDLNDRGYAYVAARVQLPDGPVDVVAVHTFAPARRGSGRRWRQSFDTLEGVVGRLRGPVVAAGDYNATLGHQPMRRFLAGTGLRDAHTAAGRGLARTFPVSRQLPLLGLIDRVAISDDVAVRSIAEVELPGSDHLGVITDLVVLRPASLPAEPVGQHAVGAPGGPAPRRRR
jgi:endonuclease/exonuclease/phosphatase (EEP) superfamily protein YafD